MKLTTQPHPVGKVISYGDIPQFPYTPFRRGSVTVIKIVVIAQASRQADPTSKEFHRMSANKNEIRGRGTTPALICGAIQESIMSPLRNLALFLQGIANVAQSRLSSRSCMKLDNLFVQYHESYSETPELVFLSGRSLNQSLYRWFVCSNLFALQISEILMLTTELKIPECRQM
jgi:hypothetical protein